MNSESPLASSISTSYNPLYRGETRNCSIFNINLCRFASDGSNEARDCTLSRKRGKQKQSRRLEEIQLYMGYCIIGCYNRASLSTPEGSIEPPCLLQTPGPPRTQRQFHTKFCRPTHRQGRLPDRFDPSNLPGC